jgi:SseB protein N-terminal domain
MTELDQALERLWQDTEVPAAQVAFYDLFLNTTFYVPTADGESSSGGCGSKTSMAPLVVEYEGEDYLVLFDREERLTGWAEKTLPYAEVPGHVLVKMSVPDLYWALNVGTEHAKQFVPDEIAWLKEIVNHSDQEDGPAGD